MTHFKVFLLSSICSVAFTGCAGYKQYDMPKQPEGLDAITLTEVAEGSERFQSNDIVSLWWEELNDTQLTHLIKDALEHNHDVEVAIANLARARAYRTETQFDYAPTITASSGLTHTRLSEETPTGAAAADRTGEIYDAGFDASWELDLFGRVRHGVKGARALEGEAFADLQNVYVTISAEVANTYAELRGLQYRLKIAKENAKNQKETHDLSLHLAQGGRNTQLDAIRAEAQLELTRSTIPTLEAAVSANMRRLAVLTGRLPHALIAELSEIKQLPSIPTVVNVGRVEDLLRRRPDVKSAEKALEAALAGYNISVANQFPVVQLSGSIGFEATEMGNFDASALAAVAGPRISWAAFNMGRVRTQIRQNDATAQAALARYEQVVLEAIEDLYTSVNDFVKEEKRRNNLIKAAKLSKEAAKLARARYEAGVDTFIDVLDAESTLLEAEDTLAQSEINTMKDIIAIYKSLSGGW